MRLFQISNGAGSGNIGDEIMNRAFWRQLDPSCELEVAAHALPKPLREPYPPACRYVPVNWGEPETASEGCSSAVLVGDTPVAEAEGLDYPLRFLAPRLEALHKLGLPVDAMGVGVEPLRTPEARRIFQEAFAPVRSWTVRTEACRLALSDLGVPSSRILVGADWAWLHAPRGDLRRWAETVWRTLGVDPARPLLAVNVVNMAWRDALPARRALASALDGIAEKHGFQIAFFCNECRDGDYYDFAAAGEILQLLRRPSVIVPNEYYTPDEAIALLGCAHMVVAQRYHTVVEAALAGTLPVCIPRGEKIRGLAFQLGLEPAGEVDRMETGRLLSVMESSLGSRDAILARLRTRAGELAQLALRNLTFLRRYQPGAAKD